MKNLKYILLVVILSFGFGSVYATTASTCEIEAEGFGDASMDTFCDRSRRSHVTMLLTKTSLYVSCMYL